MPSLLSLTGSYLRNPGPGHPPAPGTALTGANSANWDPAAPAASVLVDCHGPTAAQGNCSGLKPPVCITSGRHIPQINQLAQSVNDPQMDGRRRQQGTCAKPLPAMHRVLRARDITLDLPEQPHKFDPERPLAPGVSLSLSPAASQPTAGRAGDQAAEYPKGRRVLIMPTTGGGQQRYQLVTCAAPLRQATWPGGGDRFVTRRPAWVRRQSRRSARRRVNMIAACWSDTAAGDHHVMTGGLSRDRIMSPRAKTRCRFVTRGCRHATRWSKYACGEKLTIRAK